MVETLPANVPTDVSTNVPANTPVTWLHKTRDWVRTWWHIIHFGAVMLVLALSPSSYRRTIRAQFAEHIYSNTWQVLPWFTVLCALISLVVTRIVVVTAQSYGLSNYALEMVVRVLVLELIPLSAALFVVLNMGFFKSLTINRFDDPIDFLPQVIGSMFSVLTLAAVSSTLTLILSYLVVYGFSPWGFGEYTRMVGRVFDPMVVLIFSIKSVLFSLAVAMIPLASSLQTDVSDTPMPHGTVRLFLVLVLIEAGTLAIKYI
jgi:phospholipid/cholesterol/gamma-HCH transport system permease protein